MTRQIRIRRGVVEWREFEQEVVAVDTSKAVYMAVNRSGSILWPALLEGATREDLVKRLVETYSLDHDQAAKDVDVFVEALDDQGLLES
jgi:hypothetical protein